MKKNKGMIYKIITSLIIFFFMLNIFIPNALATDDTWGAENFLDAGRNANTTNPISPNSIKNTSDYIYNTLLAIGTIVALIMGIVLGIQFVVGGLEEKAEVKKSVIAYVIGCVIVFGAFGIWKLVVNLLQPFA